jgi:hypothetical protein
VGSASVIEIKARALPCLRCGGELEPRGDQATSTARGVLRRIDLACRLCGAPRAIHFRIAPPQLN